MSEQKNYLPPLIELRKLFQAEMFALSEAIISTGYDELVGDIEDEGGLPEGD